MLLQTLLTRQHGTTFDSKRYLLVLVLAKGLGFLSEWHVLFRVLIDLLHRIKINEI